MLLLEFYNNLPTYSLEIAMAKEDELGVQENSPEEAMDNEKAGLTDKDAVELAGVGKRQQLGVSVLKSGVIHRD